MALGSRLMEWMTDAQVGFGSDALLVVPGRGAWLGHDFAKLLAAAGPRAEAARAAVDVEVVVAVGPHDPCKPV